MVPLAGSRHSTPSRYLLRTLTILVVFATIAGLVGLFFALRKPRGSAHRPPSRLDARIDTSLTETAAVVKAGEILAVVLGRAGLASRDIGRIIPALRDAGFSFRQVRPGDSLFAFRRDSVLHRLLYQRNYETVYCVDLDSATCRVSMLLRDYRRTADIICGVIANSLYQSLLDMGENPALVADYTDIFGWEIDFFSESQPGDSYIILFERRFADDRPVGYGPILAATYSGRVGRFEGFRFADPDGSTGYYNGEGQSLRKTFLKSPLRFSRISSRFGRRFHPIRRVVRAHFGVDYVAPTGTPVDCVAEGRVVSAGWSGGYGRLVKVGHANGYTTLYGHLSSFAKGIKAGAPVVQGQVIGYVGSTGLSTGSHLHYEVHRFGSAANPLKLDPPRLSPVRQAFAGQFRALRDSLSRVMDSLSQVSPRPPSRTRP